MAYNNIYHQLHGQIMAQSAKAIQFQIWDDELDTFRTEWFPLSQISSIHRMYNPETETFDIIMTSEWVLKQKGWMKYSVAGKPPLAPVIPIKSPDLSDKLKTPPVRNFSDMDDDIPF